MFGGRHRGGGSPYHPQVPTRGRRAPSADPELLRVQDAFFLYTDTPRVRQQVGGLAMVDWAQAPSGGEPVSLSLLRDHIAAQLGHWPRLRQRLAFPRFSLARPVWVEDGSFSVEQHVFAAQLDPPGDRAALERYVASAMNQGFDRARPLWEVHLLNGLDEGRQAVLLKVHHAVADGLGTIHTGASILFDESPDAAPPPPYFPGPARPERGAPPVTGAAFRQQLARTGRTAAAGWQAALGSPGAAWRQSARTARGVWELARAGPAPASALSRPIGTRRRLLLGDLPLAEFRTVRRAHHATANEVILALASAVAAELAPANGDRTGTVRASLPVSTRRRGPLEPGSHTSALMVDIPATPLDPAERLAAVRSAMAPLKASEQPRGSQFVMAAVGSLTPPRLHAAASRWMYRGKWFNLIATNMPGPAHELYLGSAPVPVAYPIVPLAEDVALAVGAMSWADTVAIGVTTDADALPAPPTGVIEAFWRPLVEAAGAGG